MIDTGGEFKSNELRTFLKEFGINILTSVLHMHQQNGHAERFIWTIVEKAQAIRLEACIPQNWWEFAVNYAVHVYNRTPLKHSSNDYKTPFERLHHTKPDVAHLGVFRCGAYVFLPEDVQSNSLSPRSELMTFIGLVKGTKGYIFMRSPNNNVFTTIQALFDRTLFLKCLNMRWLGYTPVGLTPDDLQDEHNGPPDDENEDYGGGLLPIPYYYPRAPQGPAAYQQSPPPPLLVLSGRGSPLWSQYEDNEDVCLTSQKLQLLRFLENWSLLYHRSQWNILIMMRTIRRFHMNGMREHLDFSLNPTGYQGHLQHLNIVMTLILKKYQQSSNKFKHRVLRLIRMPVARYCLIVKLVQVTSSCDS
jgi:hypothetical protein